MPDATYKFHGGLKAGSTDVSVPVRLQNGGGEGTTGKLAADITVRYWRLGGTVQTVSPTDLAAIDSAHTDGGWKEVDATNMAGLYRLDLPDAAAAEGSPWMVVAVKQADSVLFMERYHLEPHGAMENKASIDDLLTALNGAHVDGAVQDAAPAANQFKAAAGLSATDNHYQKMLLVFTDGVNKGVPRQIESYTGATRTFDFAVPFPAAPADGDPFILIGRIE